MRALFALGTGVILGTIAALWLAARGDLRRAAEDAAPSPSEVEDPPELPDADPPMPNLLTATRDPEEATE